MVTRRRDDGRMIMAASIGWALMLAPAPSMAGLIMESPTSVGTLSVTQSLTPNPRYTLTLGGAYLTNGSDGRSGGSYSDSAFKFDLSSLPASGPISSATFQFTVAATQQVMPSGTPAVYVGGFASNTQSLTIPDFSSPQTDIGSTGALPKNSMALNETFSLDATAFVQSLVSGGVSDVGFLTSVALETNVILCGDDPSIPTAYLPSLTISFASVPEPPSLALCVLAGVFGLLAAGPKGAGRPGRRRPAGDP